jgi:hypothetical protein
MTFPAVRTKGVVHPLMRREVLERQPFAAGGAALVGWLRDHSGECLSPGLLGQGLRGCESVVTGAPSYFFAAA